jgi:hypothetical protein
MLVWERDAPGDTIKLREHPKDLNTKRPPETAAWPS